MPTTEERYLNNAAINMGEAMTELGNLRQRGVVPGSHCNTVIIALERAIAALKGEAYQPPPDVKG